MGVVSRRWMWVEPMGVATGRGVATIKATEATAS